MQVLVLQELAQLQAALTLPLLQPAEPVEWAVSAEEAGAEMVEVEQARVTFKNFKSFTFIGFLWVMK